MFGSSLHFEALLNVSEETFFQCLSHLHHGPRAEASPDHICDGLKHTHTHTNLKQLYIHLRKDHRRTLVAMETTGVGQDTDLGSVDVPELDFTSRLSLYVLVCGENGKSLKVVSSIGGQKSLFHHHLMTMYPKTGNFTTAKSQ